MLTTLKTYEGVPIGGNNFEDVMSYIRSFLGANFSFSTNAMANNGGYFSDDAFVYTAKGAGNTGAWVFTPSAHNTGSLFGRYNNEYYQFDVENALFTNPQVYEWTLLSTNVDAGSSTTSSFTYSNIDITTKMLPYRPMKGSGSTFDYGYHEVRFNGVPQTLATNYTFTYNTPASPYDFQTQKLYVSKLALGAEYPTPIFNNVYDNTGLNEQYTSTILSSTGRNQLLFPHTNFSLDFGGHILLYRPSQGLYVYVPQDTSSGAAVASGTYKVIDYSRGLIEINVNTTQLNSLIAASESYTSDTVPFDIVSAEQLQEESTSGTVNYYSRYGAVYDGDVTATVLVEYLFDGQNHTIVPIPSSSYNSTSGSLLFQDTTQQYSDGVILAIKYNGTPSVQEITKAQTTRYEPDTFTLYYSIGMRQDTVTASSDIRAMVEQNEDSWYNRDILGANYYPVSRATSTSYALLTSSEVFIPPTNLITGSDLSSDPVGTLGSSTVTHAPETIAGLGTINVVTLYQADASVLVATSNRTFNVTPGKQLNISLYINSTLANAARLQAVLTVDNVTYYLQADGITWSTTAWEWVPNVGTIATWNRSVTVTDPVPAGQTASLHFLPVYRNNTTNIPFTFKFAAWQVTEGPILYPYQGFTAVPGALSTETFFDPNYAFQIVDTIGLKNLNDVPTTWANHDTLVYNDITSHFDATPFTLASLFDVTLVAPSQGEVLSYNTSTSTWENSAVVTSFGYTPVNKAGDTGVGKLAYSAGVISSDSSLTLVDKGYSEAYTTTAVGNHAAQTNVHGALSTATASRIVIRDTAGQSRVNSPSQTSGIYNSGNAQYIANQEWVSKFVAASIPASGAPSFHNIAGQYYITWSSIGLTVAFGQFSFGAVNAFNWQHLEAQLPVNFSSIYATLANVAERPNYYSNTSNYGGAVFRTAEARVFSGNVLNVRYINSDNTPLDTYLDYIVFGAI